MNFESPQIKIGKLVIEGNLTGDLPSIVAGQGLGNAKSFSPAFIQRFMYFPAGSSSPSLEEKEGIKISISADHPNTKITALKVKPFFAIIGRNDPTKLTFPIRYRLLGTGTTENDSFPTLDPSLPTIDINLHLPASSITMDISTDTTYSTVFTSYLNTPDRPSVGFLVGFSILSIKTSD